MSSRKFDARNRLLQSSKNKKVENKTNATDLGIDSLIAEMIVQSARFYLDTLINVQFFDFRSDRFITHNKFKLHFT